MSSVDYNTNKIVKLKRKIGEINKLYKDLQSPDSVVLAKTNNSIQQITDQRLQQVEVWRQNELDDAQLNYDATLRQIANDTFYQSDFSKERLDHILILKHELLSKKLPNAAKYFNSQNCPFIKIFLHEEISRNVSINVDAPEEPLISFEEAKDFIREKKPLVKINDSELIVGGNTFTIGSNMIVKLGDMSLAGILSDLVSSTVFFTPTNGEQMAITLQAINIGLVQILK